MAVVLPPGVQIPIELPAYSIIPNLQPNDEEVQPFLVAALCTSHFPVAREQYFSLLNKSVTTYHYIRPMNRAQRRKAAR